MADDEILDEGEEEELNFVAIFVAAAIVLALIGGVVWYFFIREVPEEEKNQMPQWEAPEDLGKEYISDLLPEMIINPAGSKGRHFILSKSMWGSMIETSFSKKCCRRSGAFPKSGISLLISSVLTPCMS